MDIPIRDHLQARASHDLDKDGDSRRTVSKPDEIGESRERARIILSKPHEDRRVEAEVALRRGVEAGRASGCPNHDTIINSASNLADVLDRQGRYSPAEQLQTQALLASESALRDSTLNALNIMDKLAVVRQHARRYEQAEDMRKETLEIREKWLGSHHPDTVTNICDLIEVFLLDGREDDAAEQMRHLEGLLASTETNDEGHDTTCCG